MYKATSVFAIGKIAHGRHSAFELLGRRWIMKDFIVHVTNNDSLVGFAKTSRCRFVPESFVSYYVVDMKDQLSGQRFIFKLPNASHGLKIIENHLFALVAGGSARFDHLLCDLTRSGGSFKLT